MEEKTYHLVRETEGLTTKSSVPVCYREALERLDRISFRSRERGEKPMRYADAIYILSAGGFVSVSIKEV